MLVLCGLGAVGHAHQVGAQTAELTVPSAVKSFGGRGTSLSDVFSQASLQVRVAFSVLVAALFSLACSIPIARSEPETVLLNVLTAVSMVGCGVLLSRELKQGPWCAGLVACGFLWSARWIGSWDVGPFPVLSGYINWLVFAVGGTTLLMNPNRRLTTKLDHTIFTWFWIVAPLTQTWLVATSRPEWVGFDPSAWWFGFFANRQLFDVGLTVTLVLDAAASIAFIVALGRRVKWMVGLDRLVSIPIYVGAGALGVSSASATGEQMLAIPRPDALNAVLAVGLIVLPLGFVGAALLRRLHQATISQVLHQAFSNAQCDVPAIELALSQTLRDPSLRLYAWNDDRKQYLNGTNSLDSSVTPPYGRSVRDLVAPDGTRVAIVDFDSALEQHPSLLTTASQASAVALQNLRLHNDLQGRLEDLAASRARLAEAAIDERRRIERGLHDGVQQRLLAVVARLGLLQRKTFDSSSRQLAGEVSLEVRETLDDLRDLANGIHPSELRQFGLRSAIDVVAERLPIDIAIDVADIRLTANSEATLYFVACEAMANVVKHAQATRIGITAKSIGNEFVLEIQDNGNGEANMTGGTGLRGCDDRMRSIGGQFEVVPGIAPAGSMVRAKVPLCE